MIPFRERAEKLFAYCYEGVNAPTISIESERAVWYVDPGEIWGTGSYDRITRLVLAAHRFRIQAFVRPQDDKVRVSLEERSHAPNRPLEHHPGLSDLISRAYQFGGKRSDAEMLVQACSLIEDLLHPEQHSDLDLLRTKGFAFLSEVQKR